MLDASGGLEIGDYTHIGGHTSVWSHSAYLQPLRSETGKTSKSIIRKPTKIGKNCWIGGPSVIYPGITIGDYVVILPMSVVTRSLLSGFIYGGSPAKKIRKIKPEEIKTDCNRKQS